MLVHSLLTLTLEELSFSNVCVSTASWTLVYLLISSNENDDANVAAYNVGFSNVRMGGCLRGVSSFVFQQTVYLYEMSLTYHSFFQMSRVRIHALVGNL